MADAEIDNVEVTTGIEIDCGNRRVRPTSSRYDERIDEVVSSIRDQTRVWAMRERPIYDLWTMRSSVLRATRKRCVDPGTNC